MAETRHQATRLDAIEGRFDPWLLGATLALACLGVVMVGSSSIAIAEGLGVGPFHFLVRHLVYLAAGSVLALWLALVWLAPSFGWCAIPLFFQCLRQLRPRLAVPLAAVLTAAVVLAQVRLADAVEPSLVLGPVGVAVTNDIPPDAKGCDAPAGSDCIKQVLLMPTPVLWWGGVVALLFSVVMWIGARDWRYGLAVVGALSTWLPWMLYDDRPIFIFYAIAILPFTIIATTLAIGTLIGPSRLPSARRTVGVVVGGAFVVLTLLNFAWFWPIFTNQMLTHSEWLDRVWFSRWV